MCTVRTLSPRVVPGPTKNRHTVGLYIRELNVTHLSVLKVRREYSEYDLLVFAADGTVAPGHGLAQRHRLPGDHELVEHVQAPFLPVLHHELLCKGSGIERNLDEKIMLFLPSG